MADTLYRWWRSPYAGMNVGGFAQTSFNMAVPQVGITEGQTMARIRGDHMAWHNPLTNTPSTPPTVMGTPHTWLIVWDDGTDPNIGTGNLDYMLSAHTHDILHQASWHWTDVWGFGTFDQVGSKAAFWDGVRDHTFDVKVSRRWNPAGAEIQYPRYVSEARLTPQGHPLLPYHFKLSIMLLAATPNVFPTP
jgi:hypothetical protein